MTDLVPVDETRVLQTLGINPRDPKAQLVVLLAQRYDLDPLLKHVQLIPVGGGTQPYITRDGYLHVAHRSGQFDGMEVIEEKETPGHYIVKVSVWRRDMSHPFTATGRAKKDERNAVDMALTRAERRALRRAFDVAGVAEPEAEWDEMPELRDEGGNVTQLARPTPRELDHPVFQEPEIPTAPAQQQEADDELTQQLEDSLEKPTPAQMRKLHALLNGKGIKGDDRHPFVSRMVGHILSSLNDLSRDEASKVIDELVAGEQ